MRLERSWRPIEEDVTLACHEIHKVLQEDDEISQDTTTDILEVLEKAVIVLTEKLQPGSFLI